MNEVIGAGEPLNPEIIDQIRKAWGLTLRDGYGQTDVSVSFNVNDNIQINLEGINITDEATTGYTMDPSFPTTYELSGRRVSFGLRASF